MSWTRQYTWPLYSIEGSNGQSLLSHRRVVLAQTPEQICEYALAVMPGAKLSRVAVLQRLPEGEQAVLVWPSWTGSIGEQGITLGPTGWNMAFLENCHCEGGQP